MSAFFPAVLLLFWSGVAATALVSLVLAPLLGEPVSALAASPARPTAARAVLAGLLLLPVLYLLGFVLLREPNLVTGGILGVLHALVLALRSLLHGGRSLARQNTNRMLLCVAYGAILGFAYVMP